MLLAGIAYVMARSRTQGPTEDGLFVRYEGGDMDDYVFRGTAHGRVRVHGPGQEGWAIKTPLRLGHDRPRATSTSARPPSALQEKISPGDRISGIVWLQGFVLP